MPMLFRLLLAVAIGLCAASPALAAKRLALVIGNDAYKNVPKLQKAVNDASAIGAALGEIGFTVVSGQNVSRRDMNQKLAALEQRIEPGDIVFFFFAGHGVAIGGENVLLPTDIPAVEAGPSAMVQEEGITVDNIVRRIQNRGAATTFLVLDACRNNPFEAGGTRDIGQSRGLAEVKAPKGVFVLYSAGIGQTALDRLSDSDDTNANSVFTRKLLPALKTPGLSQVAIAKRMQVEVGDLAATVSHEQVPAYYDQIRGEVMINPAADGAAVPAAQAEPQVAAAAPAETVKLASLPVEPTPADTRQLTLSIQSALKGRGCLAVEPTGKWGKLTQTAMARFNKAVNGSVAIDAPSSEALALLQSNTQKCPLACKAWEYLHAEGFCVKRTCADNGVLWTDGGCVPRGAVAPHPANIRPVEDVQIDDSPDVWKAHFDRFAANFSKEAVDEAFKWAANASEDAWVQKGGPFEFSNSFPAHNAQAKLSVSKALTSNQGPTRAATLVLKQGDTTRELTFHVYEYDGGSRFRP